MEKNNDVGILGQVTDIHANRCIDICNAVQYLNSIRNIIPFDVLVNSGDIGIERAVSDEVASILLSRNSDYMNPKNLWLFCKGNHDYRVSINAETLYTVLNMPTIYNHDITYGDNNNTSYGYYDTTRLKFRYIYINTSEGDTNAYTMSNDQVKWIKNALLSVPEGYGVIILSHLCIDKIGRWASSPHDADADCFEALRKMFPDFVAKTNGSQVVGEETISWDFSSAPSSSKLVCVLSGDSHFDNYVKRDGVNYIVRQGYGVVSEEDVPAGATYTDEAAWLSKTHKCCFDVLVTNKGGGAKIFRIGIGCADRDLAFTY